MYSNQKEYIQSVEIHRDGLYSPWGFRLKGGIDVDGGTPLEIVKVSRDKIWTLSGVKCRKLVVKCPV